MRVIVNNVMAEKVVKVPAKTYDLLGLSQEQAEALVVIMAKVSGDPNKSGRKHTDAIGEALSRAGLAYNAAPVYRFTQGDLFFKVPEEVEAETKAAPAPAKRTSGCGGCGSRRAGVGVA